MTRKKLVADNVDYASRQISFLDGEQINSDCVVQFGLFCRFCGATLGSKSRVIYYLAGAPQRRICKVCYKKYKQTFDIGACRKKSEKGGK